MIVMKTIEIFDPAMCCITGVCGPSIDSELMRVATVINAYKAKGIVIKRYGLSSEPQNFVANQTISELLKKEGPEVLPVVLVDGKVEKLRTYPSNAEFEQWIGVAIDQMASEQECACGPKGCC